MRSLISRQPKLALGVKIALAFAAHGKGHGATLAAGPVPVVPDFGTLLPQTIVRKALKKQVGTPARQDEAASVSKTLAGATVTSNVSPVAAVPVMSYEEARLWLQAYNAGPYALLKYKGNVPYRETRNYVPRVMKYYAQKLDGSPYDKYIVASAAKYGLDPQLIRAVMKAESDFNNRTVSHAGARGLMQVMPVVWSHVKKKYGMNWNYSGGVFEPEKNIEVACAYLAWLRYDFLPRHFADFEDTPPPPASVVRDRGIPARKTSRIMVNAPNLPVAVSYERAASTLNTVAASVPPRGEVEIAKTAAALFSTFTSSSSAPVDKDSQQLAEKLRQKAKELGEQTIQALGMAGEDAARKSRKAKGSRAAGTTKSSRRHS